MASKRLGALPRIKRGAQGRGCGREGSGALPLARAAAVSTGLRVRGVGELLIGATLAQRAEVARALPPQVDPPREVRVVRLLELEHVRREAEEGDDRLHRRLRVLLGFGLGLGLGPVVELGIGLLVKVRVWARVIGQG